VQGAHDAYGRILAPAVRGAKLLPTRCPASPIPSLARRSKGSQPRPAELKLVRPIVGQRLRGKIFTRRCADHGKMRGVARAEKLIAAGLRTDAIVDEGNVYWASRHRQGKRPLSGQRLGAMAVDCHGGDQTAAGPPKHMEPGQDTRSRA